MKKFLEFWSNFLWKVRDDLRNPRFMNKGLYILFLPVCFLPFRVKCSVRDFSKKHWSKFPDIAHRLYWSTFK